MRELLDCGEPATLPRKNLCQALAAALFHEFFDLAGLGLSEEPPLHPAVERALRTMKQGMGGSLNLASIARTSGTSPQHLSRLFNGATGVTPMRHLWRMREDEGMRLLRETGLTIAQIAEACGFQNAFHFTRRMRERFGVPPRDLRRRAWGSAG